jgi:hypothetical protein
MQGGGKNHAHGTTTALGGDCGNKAVTDWQLHHTGLAGAMTANDDPSLARQIVRLI